MFRSAERTCSNPDTANVDEPIFATPKCNGAKNPSFRPYLPDNAQHATPFPIHPQTQSEFPANAYHDNPFPFPYDHAMSHAGVSSCHTCWEYSVLGGMQQ